MTSQQIGVLIALGKHLNFSKTADSLYVSQSYISKQISALEQEWNIALFYRNHHSVALTPAGRYLYNFFSEYQDKVVEAVRHAKSLESISEAPLKLGVLSVLEARHLPEIIKGFRDICPEVSITMSFRDEESLINGFWQDKFDLIITNQDSISKTDKTKIHTIRESMYYLCVSKAILSCYNTIQDAFDQIRHLPLIDLAGSELSDRKLIDQVRLRYHIPVEERIDAPNPESLYRMVESEMGFSFITKVPETLPAEPKISFVNTGIPYKCVVLYREDAAPELERFAAALVEHWEA